MTSTMPTGTTTRRTRISTRNRTPASARCSPSSGPDPTANRSLPRSRPASTTRSPCSLPSAVAPTNQEEESTADNVVPLRRRWLPRAAVAAAAVIVLGAGGVFVANLGQMSQTGQNSASDSAGESKAEAPGSSSDSESGLGLGHRSRRPPGAERVVVRERRGNPARGTTRVGHSPPRASLPTSRPRQNRENAEPGAPGALTSQACPGPRITDGAVPNLVKYDGRPAVLLIHPESGGQQVVDAWNCAGNRKLASTTITP